MTVSSGQLLVETGVLAILRAKRTAEHLPAVLDTLVDNGIRCLEITTNTPGALAAVTETRSRYGDAVEVGLGTVLTLGDVVRAGEAGAQFVVSPHLDAELITAAAELGLACYPGALTPTEVLIAHRRGATAIKIFPASLGGPRYLRELRAPFDDVRLLPTGGVGIDQIPEYLAAGATAVGLGSALLGDALDGGSTADLAARAAKAVALAAGAR